MMSSSLLCIAGIDFLKECVNRRLRYVSCCEGTLYRAGESRKRVSQRRCRVQPHRPYRFLFHCYHFFLALPCGGTLKRDVSSHTLNIHARSVAISVVTLTQLSPTIAERSSKANNREPFHQRMQIITCWVLGLHAQSIILSMSPLFERSVGTAPVTVENSTMAKNPSQ
jgi:hypothetical protein